MRAPSDVVAAVATPSGEGALGMLRMSGPGSLGLSRSFLRWSADPPPPRAAVLALAHEGGVALDKVLAIYFQAPRSYTGEEMVELTAHGSPYILSRLLDLACQAGARPADPGEFTQRAFINGRMDLAQAEAVCALIRSRTRWAHRVALRQMEGRLSGKLRGARDSLIDLLAAIEAALDHPEEDIPEFSAAQLAGRTGELIRELAALRETYRVGRIALDGARVSIVGCPNAGKSSLLNALLGRERAIVAAGPGTTRDTLEEQADFDGLRAVLVDTAGLREGALDPVELEGMERTRRALEGSDLVLCVLDRSQPFAEAARSLAREVDSLRRRKEVASIAVLNKCDLPARMSARELGASWKAIEVSALRSTGLERLARAVHGELVGSGPEGQGEGDPVLLLCSRHHQAVEASLQALAMAERSCDEPELAAVHLREAIQALGAILGESTAEDVLRSVFSKFCIGK